MSSLTDNRIFMFHFVTSANVSLHNFPAYAFRGVPINLLEPIYLLRLEVTEFVLDETFIVRLQTPQSAFGSASGKGQPRIDDVARMNLGLDLQARTAQDVLTILQPGSESAASQLIASSSLEQTIVIPRACALSHSSSSRVALHDSTNTSPCLGKRSIDQIQPYSTKRVTFPTSSARLQGSPSRCYGFSGSPPRFPVARKAPPTVSISFSSASSQRWESGLDAQDLELPDVRNVVPFPCAPLDGNGDIEMLDGTCLPSAPGLPAHSLSLPLPLRRKRRSAYSVSAPTLPSNRKDRSDKDLTDGSVRKRARRTRRQTTDIFWLSVIHRSISVGLCESESTPPCRVDTCACNGDAECRRVRRKTIEAQDRLLAGKIWQKLVDNGCHSGPTTRDERRIVPLLPSQLSPLLPMSTPSALMPSAILTLPMPTGEAKLETGVDPRKPSAAASSVIILEFPHPPSPRSNPLFFPKPSSPIAMPSTPQTIYDDFPMRPPTTLDEKDTRPYAPSTEIEPTSHRTNLRRSPSPPSLQRRPLPSRSATPTSQLPTPLTMPQLVASLILSHRERSSLRTKGKSSKSNSGKSKREEADRTREPASQEISASPKELEDRHESTRTPKSQVLRNAGRRSPLCQVAYVDDPELNSPC
ncbi:hypothetical protein BKA82DRAFT_33831 [Pisolithus tinctorius]|nr:hypothetical protein BKA82DRAFT_33831 [Pisolithus tinctorius]